MNPKVQAVLVFLRLVDSHDGNLSLTNLAVIAAIAKFAFLPISGVFETAAMAVIFASYIAKKYLNKNAAPKSDAELSARIDSLDSRMDEMQSKVTAMSVQAGIRNLLGKQP